MSPRLTPKRELYHTIPHYRLSTIPRKDFFTFPRNARSAAVRVADDEIHKDPDRHADKQILHAAPSSVRFFHYTRRARRAQEYKRRNYLPPCASRLQSAAVPAILAPKISGGARPPIKERNF